jgi:WD40 repeat protein
MLMCMNLHENTLSCGYEDGSLLEWDLRKPNQVWKEVCLYEGGDSPVMCIQSNSRMVVTGSTPNQDLILRADESMKRCKVVSGVNDISILESGMIASGGWDGKIRIFSPKMKPITILKHHLESIHCLDSTNEILASGSKDQRISLWNLDF